MTSPSLSFDSLAVHAGREDLNALGVHAAPIDLSSTNPLPDVELGGLSYEAMANGGEPGPGGNVYARLWNPTVARFESALAQLERASASVAFASGMAAMSATLIALSQGKRDAHVVAVRPLYGGTDHLLASSFLGVETTFCEATAVERAMRPSTVLVVLETPANPTLDLVDIGGIVAAAGDVPVLVDNTFATPVLQNPLEHGASLVLHSATKFIGGHGDVVGGVVACGADLAASLRRTRAITGAVLHPLAAYLLHRGLTTLPVRVRAQQRSAIRLVEWLTGHPDVVRVHFPANDPAWASLAGVQMKGPGSMLSAQLRGGPEQVDQVTRGVRLFTHAVSLGGVDSLIQSPSALTHRPVAPEARPRADLVRISVGLEDVEDLERDLAQALDPGSPAHSRR
ncbi:MAG: aminotransferase class I/II-fold pyridoxal phosphate-dependent enzyme [Nocardioides sp.]|nr:aminotransferase class I/II-fold pyridoxal phosphate-dependent enzyme [Nocardioides sp.]